MTQMGFLAFELQNSVSEIHTIKLSPIFCSKYPQKWLKCAIYTVSTLFILAAGVTWIYISIFTSNWHEFDGSRGTTYGELQKWTTMFARTNWFLFLPLDLCICFYYTCMASTLNRSIADVPNLQKQRR
jgi:hypothetical protein